MRNPNLEIRNKFETNSNYETPNDRNPLGAGLPTSPLQPTAGLPKPELRPPIQEHLRSTSGQKAHVQQTFPRKRPNASNTANTTSVISVISVISVSSVVQSLRTGCLERNGFTTESTEETETTIVNAVSNVTPSQCCGDFEFVSDFEIRISFKRSRRVLP